MKVLHVLSGGLDSTVVLADNVAQFGAANVMCVNFEYGSKHNARERGAAIQICKELKVPLRLVTIVLPFTSALLKGDEQAEVPEGHYEDENMRATVVPFRNGIMLAYAVGLAESLGFELVTIGAHSGDHAIYPDCRPEFLRAMDAAACAGTYKNVHIIAPYAAMSKGDIVRAGAELGAPMELTWTCYKGGAKHCGKCGACVERAEAFMVAGVPDPTQWEEACTQ